MKITPEMIQALKLVRKNMIVARHHLPKLVKALETLDNAGVFDAIDEASDYDTNSDA